MTWDPDVYYEDEAWRDEQDRLWAEHLAEEYERAWLEEQR